MKVGTLVLIILSLFSVVNIAVAAPFVDLENQTILDRKTGLIWQQTDDNRKRKWTDAMLYCEGLNLDGKDNWRLPNIRELRTIVNYSAHEPAIDGKFSSTKFGTDYWSSTSREDNATNAWGILFDYGAVSDSSKVTMSYVRCVRNKR